MALISRNAKPKPSSWRKAGPRGAGQEWQRFNHAAGSEALPFARATEVVGRFAVSVKRKTQTVVLAQGRTSRCEPRMEMVQSRGRFRGPAVRLGDVMGDRRAQIQALSRKSDPPRHRLPTAPNPR